METIWDHNPTDAELERLAISERDYEVDQDTHYIDIIAIIGMRGGSLSDQMAYARRIQDAQTRQETILLLNEIVD